MSPCATVISESLFLSTPSARRATRVLGKDLVAVPISIHALCEEGDEFGVSKQWLLDDFYPRPLRGGRRRKTKRPPTM